MVSRNQIISKPAEGLNLRIFPKELQKAFLAATNFPFLSCDQWYLAGGTGLALQVGHRQSQDLDFFSPYGKFQERNLERHLFNTGAWVTTFQQKGTLYGKFMGAKMSFIAYPFFTPSPERIRCGKICILFPADIAAMKIVAISQRGRKRDFVDLYWYLQNSEPIDEVMRRSIRQYPGQEKNLTHILKSLVYFEDAEDDPMPKLFFEADWRGIKSYFRREIPKIAKEILKLR